MTASWNMCSQRTYSVIFLPFGRDLWPQKLKETKNQPVYKVDFLFLKGPLDFIRKRVFRTLFCLKHPIMRLYSALVLL